MMLIRKGPTVPPLIAVAVISLLVGGVGGYYVRFFQEPEYGSPGPMPGSSETGGMSGMGGMGGMMGMGGTMGGGQEASQNSITLVRLVRNLSLIEKVQNQGLKSEQAQALVPVLKGLQSADKLSDKDCEAAVEKIRNLLTDSQGQALENLQPPRGGGGGGGMMGGGMMGGMMGGSGGSPPQGAAGGAGAPQSENPFASDRNRQSLDELIALLEPRSNQ